MHKLLRISARFVGSSLRMEYQPIVLSGPSGGGKSTLVKKLMSEFPGCFSFSISHTTRNPRPGETNGKEYHFVTREEMSAAITNNEFIEHAEFSGNLYGTSKKAVRDVQATNKLCILDVEIKGVKNLKKTDLNPRYIFIKPPNMKVLEERLVGRGSETKESLQSRLDTAKESLDYAEVDGAYDHIIVNDELEVAYEKLKGILIKDIHKLQKDQHSAYSD